MDTRLKEKERLTRLRAASSKVLAGFNALFQTPRNGCLAVRDFDRRPVIEVYGRLLSAISAEIAALLSDGAGSKRLVSVYGASPDSIDYLNSLVSEHGGAPLTDSIAAGALDIMTAGALFESCGDAGEAPVKALEFQLSHAKTLIDDGPAAIAEYIGVLRALAPENVVPRLHPEADAFLAPGTFVKDVEGSDSIVDALRQKALDADSFRTGRVFRYCDSEFAPVRLAPIRKVDEFFGYREARDLFKRYFAGFAEHGENLPLLISSHPGLGKTHFTISHALSFENLTLVLPEPENLERPLEGLLRALAARKSREFVVFFDDIDTRKVDWYYFRTQIGGSFVLPDNVAVVIASNHQFPANISSRGRGFEFPLFDEVECQKMVEDFLRFMGMRNPPPALASVIAADYVEEYGQHVFEELSPRTLARYLERYNEDARKRKRMLDLSREEIIAVPDAQAFYDANQSVTDRLNRNF